MELAVARSASGYTHLRLVTEMKMLAPQSADGKVMFRWARKNRYDGGDKIDWKAARM